MIKRNHAVMTHAFFTDMQSVRSFQLFASTEQGNTELKEGNCELYLSVCHNLFLLIFYLCTVIIGIEVDLVLF